MALIPAKTKRTINLYSIAFPILIIAAVLLIGSNTDLTLKDLDFPGSVLSSKSGKDGDNKDKDDDKEDKDDNSGRGSKDDEDKDDDRDDDKDNDSSGRGGSEDKENESKTRETITNSDGTTTEVRREVKDDEVKVEFRTFDDEGNKIKVEKYESDEDEEKTRVKVYDTDGTKLSDLRLETKDGKRVEFRVKEGETELSRVRYDANDQKLIIRMDETESEGDESSLVIRQKDDSFQITRGGINALVNFPITVDDETGEVFVETPNGNVALKAMPDTILEKALLSDETESIDSLELVGDEDQLRYRLTGTKTENLLGIFQVEIPTQLIYDAETEDFLSSEQSTLTRILDLFSF